MSAKRSDGETLARLCALAAEQAGIDSSSVAPDSDLFAELNFDSLDAVEYVMKIEDEFDVSVTDQSAENVRTPRQAFDMLLPVLTEKCVDSGGG